MEQKSRWTRFKEGFFRVIPYVTATSAVVAVGAASYGLGYKHGCEDYRDALVEAAMAKEEEEELD